MRCYSTIYAAALKCLEETQLPWGDTTDANLETKCASCNLGKGNAFDA